MDGSHRQPVTAFAPLAIGTSMTRLVAASAFVTLSMTLTACGPESHGDDDDSALEFSTQPSCIDADNDGACSEEDCDDLNPDVAPERAEVLCNDLDDDCEPATEDSPDADGDGHSLCVEDCDDDPLASPSQVEQCRGGLDEDCDGTFDCFDRDCEGTLSCRGQCGNGLIEDGEECDDANDTVGDGCSQCRTEVETQSAGEVTYAPGDLGDGFRDANNAVNGVRGGGPGEGSTDTFSLGYSDGIDNYIIIRWHGLRVLNGPGDDVAIFENPFSVGVDGMRFMDQVVLYFSQDGDVWVPFPHDYLAADETVYSTNPDHWQGFAGITPVLLHEDSNWVDPFDPALAGGDHFDLDELHDHDLDALSIKESGFSYLKLVTAPSALNPDTGEPFVRDMASDGADIDGVYARYLVLD